MRIAIDKRPIPIFIKLLEKKEKSVLNSLTDF